MNTKTIVSGLTLATMAFVAAAWIFGPNVVRGEGLDRTDDIKVSHRDTLIDKLRADGHYKVFLNALNDTALTEKLSSDGPYTVFAPTDDAFAKLPNQFALLNDKAQLVAVLKFHIVPFSRIDSHDLDALRTAMTLKGEYLEFKQSGIDIKVNNALIVQSDLKAVNGVAHGIGAVLMPKDASDQYTNDKTFGDNVKSAGDTMYHGLKHGASKIKHAFGGGD